MTTEEIRIRQMTNQHLTGSVPMTTVVRDLCGVQAQFVSHAMHALRIRSEDFDESTAAEALCKSWTLRGTMHLFASDDLPLFTRGDTYRLNDWHAPSFWNQRSCWALTPERQAYLTQAVLDALAHGPQTREALKAACRERGMTDAEEGSMFDPWGGGVREMCERGFIHGLAQEEKAYRLSPAFVPMQEADAQMELARRYFTHMGPATVRDAAYFFGKPQRLVKQWLDALPVMSAACEGRTYYWIERDISYAQQLPACIFLAGFDQMMLAYDKRESLYLQPEHVGRVFSRSGMVFPTVLLHGRVSGTWKRKPGCVEISLFAPPDEADGEAIFRAAGACWGERAQVKLL